MRKQWKKVWIYGAKDIKTVIRVRKKQCNVSSHMNYLQFCFKGPKYIKYSFFIVDFLADFLKY